MSTLDRRTFSAALAAAACTPGFAAPKHASSVRNILFVCQFGTVKSAIARELLKRRAAELRIPLLVTSRGITPEKHLPPDLRSRLAAEGIDPDAQPLRKLHQRDLDSAEVVILFDPLPPRLVKRNARDWTDLPSMLNDYPHARAELDRRIDAFLRALAP